MGHVAPHGRGGTHGCRRLVAGLFLLALLLLLALPASATTLAPTVELRQIGDLMVPYQSGMPLPTYEPQGRPRIELTDGWRMLRANLSHELSLTFRDGDTILALEQEAHGATRPDFDDKQWLTTLLPSAANQPPRGGPNGVWYRRRLNIPALWQGKRVLLHCLAANYLADVWVNGKYVGYHEGGFTPFSFDITRFLDPASPNVIALRVDNPPWQARGSEPQQGVLPPGPADWWNATGVLRDIYLEAVPAVSVVRADVRVVEGPVEASDTGVGERFQVTVVLRNAGNESFTGRLALQVFPTRVGEANLISPRVDAIALMRQPVEVLEGNTESDITVAGNSVVAWNETFITEELSTWAPAKPHLNMLEVMLRTDEGQVQDRLTTQFGIRSLAVDKQQPRLLLNGKPLYLVGVNRVEDDPQLGRAFSYRDGLRMLLDLRNVKWLGGNFVRLGHGVAHPLTTLITDRLGLMCWEEIPAAWLSAEAMQAQWEQRHISRQMFLEMIYQDYNRPSVGFWGVGHMLAPGGVHRDFVRDLADMGRFLDGTRLIGESAPLDDRGPNQTETDVLGYALDASQGANQDALAEALATLDRRHRALSAKPVIITEFGARAGADTSAWDRQVAAAEDVLPTLAARPFVGGAAWWTQADYLSPDGVRFTGLLTRDRRTTRTVNQTLLDEFRLFLKRPETEPGSGEEE